MEQIELFLEGNHEYTYTKEEKDGKEIHTLHYSNNPIWEDKVRGQKACWLVDDGNGFDMNYTDYDLAKGYIDYAEMSQLKYLLEIVVKEPKAEYYKKVDL